jgi:hypothetical protein
MLHMVHVALNPDLQPDHLHFDVKYQQYIQKAFSEEASI